MHDRPQLVIVIVAYCFKAAAQTCEENDALELRVLPAFDLGLTGL